MFVFEGENDMVTAGRRTFTDKTGRKLYIHMSPPSSPSGVEVELVSGGCNVPANVTFQEYRKLAKNAAPIYVCKECGDNQGLAMERITEEELKLRGYELVIVR